jgi:3-oxoadipate enol-lactonase
LAFVERGSARIWWSASDTRAGEREALVLIMGLGCSSDMWFRIAPSMAQRHRVILIDNRGTGRSTVGGALVHRVDAMAGDVAAVMDAAGERSAHICGFSMGGMIAQEFALEFPERTLSLMLLGTHCGTVHSVKAGDKVLRLLFSKDSATPDDSLALMRPHVYAAATPAERIAEDHAIRLDYYPTLRGYQAQLYGLMAWSGYSRISSIEARTLVLHGLEDELIPPANGRMLAERIPGAHLEELKNASHWLKTDQTERTLALMKAFMRPAHPSNKSR